jgi:hypothetical protein
MGFRQVGGFRLSLAGTAGVSPDVERSFFGQMDVHRARER